MTYATSAILQEPEVTEFIILNFTKVSDENETQCMIS